MTLLRILVDYTTPAASWAILPPTWRRVVHGSQKGVPL